MANNLSFAALLPEPLTFSDDAFGGDGTQYAVQTPDTFSALAFAEFEAMQRELQAARQQLGDGAPDAALIQQLEQISDRILRILVPDLPDARRAVIPFGFRLRLLSWWEEETTARAGGAATSPLARLPRGKRSRGSSSATASTPSAS